MSPEMILLRDKYHDIKIKSWKYRKILVGGRDFCFHQFSKNTAQAKAKPFVKWVGGKRQLLSQFHKLYPQNFNPQKNTYFEPFIGGGAVFFDLQPYQAEISDVNEELIITYQVIQNQVEELIESLQKHIYEKEYFLKVRAQNPKDLSNIERASRFIFLNRTCFNGLYRVNQKGGFNTPFGRYTNPIICDSENLRNVSKTLEHTKIFVRSYSEVLKNAKKGDFIYFDPPYIPLNVTSNFTSYTKDSFGLEEQKKLRDTFAELSKRGCFVMLSNSDTSLTRELYQDFMIRSVQAGRAINSKGGSRGKVGEVVVCNY
ncbi:MAG: DNA adenine methylase [Candidatus Peregrinibacteria bacterium]